MKGKTNDRWMRYSLRKGTKGLVSVAVTAFTLTTMSHGMVSAEEGTDTTTVTNAKVFAEDALSSADNPDQDATPLNSNSDDATSTSLSNKKENILSLSSKAIKEADSTVPEAKNANNSSLEAPIQPSPETPSTALLLAQANAKLRIEKLTTLALTLKREFQLLVDQAKTVEDIAMIVENAIKMEDSDSAFLRDKQGQKGTPTLAENKTTSLSSTSIDQQQSQDLRLSDELNVAQKGTFNENHVYITYIDDQETQREEVTKDQVSGFTGETFTTGKIDRPNFTLSSVDSVGNLAVSLENPQGTFDFEDGTNQSVTYTYKQKLYTGTFQEEHIYRIFQDGYPINAIVIHGEYIKGLDGTEFITKQIPREGFTFVKIVDNYGNVIPDATNLFEGKIAKSITYIYRTDTSSSGSFQEHHQYETYQDGKLVSTEIVDGELFENIAGTVLKTSQIAKEGFTFVEAKDIVGYVSPNEWVELADQVNATVTYVYRRDITSSGSFQEHHKYETYQDGKLIDTQVVDGEVITGKAGTEFTTGQVAKDGYTFVNTSDVVGEVTPDAKGVLEDKVDKAITYVYRKDITTSGTFQEHHKYETYQDGKLINTQMVDGEVITAIAGTEFTTGQVAKDGFTFVETTDNVGGVTPDAKGVIEDKVDKAITYVYRKELITRPNQPEGPIKPEKPAKPGEGDTPNKPDHSQKPGEDHTPNHPGHAGDDSPTTPGDGQKPSQPENPEQPNQPAKTNPSEVTDPTESTNSSKKQERQLPETGEGNTQWFGTAALSILTGLGILYTHHQKKDSHPAEDEIV